MLQAAHHQMGVFHIDQFCGDRHVYFRKHANRPRSAGFALINSVASTRLIYERVQLMPPLNHDQ
jgi:hypothetical protein